MNYSILILLGILFLSIGAFAAPVLQDPVITPSAISPLTGTEYFKFNIDINAEITGNVPGDFNSDSVAWYSLTDANTALPVSYDVDNNRVYIANLHLAQNGDYNFRMIVQNGQGDTNYFTGYVHIWSDENAPTSTWGVIRYYNGFTILPVFAKDGMTAQEAGENALPETYNGSGIQNILYTVDGGEWQSLAPTSSDPTVPTDITITGVGDHNVLVCVEDNLDTNSCAGASGEWYKEDLRVDEFGGNTGTCNLIGLIIFILAAVAIIVFIYGAFGIVSGEVGVEHLVAIGISAIMVIIILFIGATISSLICVV